MGKTNIEWCHYSWNVLTGCTFGCEYCYARRIASRFHENYPNGFYPTFHSKRLDEPLHIRKPSRIFVCSMGDFWSPEISDDIRIQIINVMNRCSQHRFIILTKRPETIHLVELMGENIWLGVSVDRPGAEKRLDVLRGKTKGQKVHTCISLEPILGPIKPNLEGIEAAMLGGQTNPDNPPQWEWVELILEEADRTGTKVFMKDNLHAPPDKIRREYPTALIPEHTLQQTL